MAEDPQLKEYYELLAVVKDFDRNLLMVKGWGATVGLAALAWGFQYGHYGIFLVACLSGLCFWAIEAAMKRHQMRSYVRMREIEVRRAEHGEHSPQIDWGWKIAPEYLSGKTTGQPGAPERYRGSAADVWLYWLYLHVALPHAVAVIAGFVLFLLGRQGSLGDLKP